MVRPLSPYEPLSRPPPSGLRPPRRLRQEIRFFISGLILAQYGTGPVKGFAVTMSLGIFTSMFTAIMVTRAMVNLIFGGRDFKKLWI